MSCPALLRKQAHNKIKRAQCTACPCAGSGKGSAPSHGSSQPAKPTFQNARCRLLILFAGQWPFCEEELVTKKYMTMMTMP